MNINFKTDLYRTFSYKSDTIFILRAIDKGAVKEYDFFISKELYDFLNVSLYDEIQIEGFSAKGKDGLYRCFLNKLFSLDPAETVYQYCKNDDKS